jgi:hypothetical protein
MASDLYVTRREHSPASATGHRMGAHDLYRHLALPRFARVTRQDQVAVAGHGVGQEPPAVLKASLKSSASERKWGVVPSIDFRKTSRSPRSAAVSSV